MIDNYGLIESPQKYNVFLRACCEELNTTVSLITKKTKKREIARKRQVIQYILHRIAGIGQADVGKITGGFDHATVLHACRTISNDLEKKYHDVTTAFEIVSSLFYKIVEDPYYDIIAEFEKCTTVFNPIKHD
jgi:chromosomal replication initiation ATPase DnaA